MTKPKGFVCKKGAIRLEDDNSMTTQSHHHKPTHWFDTLDISLDSNKTVICSKHFIVNWKPKGKIFKKK